MINNYHQYLIESFLRTSDRLKGLLKKIEDPVASNLLALVDTDIKTQYNGLDYLDKENNKLSFLTDSQFNNKLKSVSNYRELISDKNNSSSVGRIVKNILKDNGIDKTDREIENFVNKFKSSLNSDEKIKIVSGEDIRYWYLEENYYGKNDGTLWNSCMRYDRCQKYLDIYVENENVSLVVMTIEDKLVARALLWDKIEDGGKYLDRIYYTSDQYKTQMSDWAKKNIDDLSSTYESGTKVTVNLSKYKFAKYPYMDTFRYSDDSGLFAKNADDLSIPEWIYSSTTGGRESIEEERVYSNIHGYSIDIDESYYSYHYDDYLDISSDDVVWSDYDDVYYLLRDCVLTKDSQYILETEAIECVSEKGLVYVHIDSGDWYEYDDENYHIDYGVDTLHNEMVPLDKAIRIVDVIMDDVPDNLTKIVTLYGGPNNLDEKVAEYLNLSYEVGEEKYIGINEYPEWSIEDDMVRDGLQSLVDLKNKKIINLEGFEYISNQLFKSIDIYCRKKTRSEEIILGVNKQELLKFWSSMVESNWEKIINVIKVERILSNIFPAYNYPLKDIIKKISEDPEITKELIKNFFMSDVITKYVKKKLGVDMGRIGSMSSFYGLLYWDIMPLIIKIYKENYYNQRNGMFPIDEKEYIDNLFKLNLLKYYLR